MARWHSTEYHWWPKSGPLANRGLNIEDDDTKSYHASNMMQDFVFLVIKKVAWGIFEGI